MSNGRKLLKNEPDSELERLAQAAQDALTDNMVERLSTTGANALEVVDRLNDEETKEAVHYAIDQLTELHRIGGLQTLFETVALLHAARSAATDSIIERLFEFVEHTVNTLGTDEVATLVDNVRVSMDEAMVEVHERPAKGGLMAAISLLSKPETQRSLQLFCLVGEKLQKNSSGES